MSPFLLYDLPSKDGNICWSPYTWKIRLALNYKGIDYETVFLDYPDVAPTLKAFGIPPGDPALGNGYDYTIPSAQFPDHTYAMESMSIIKKIESLPEYRNHLPLNIDDPFIVKAEAAIEEFQRAFYTIFLPGIRDILNERSRVYFERTRSERLGMTLTEMERSLGGEAAWEASIPALRGMVELLQSNDGPFLLGDKVCYGDFVLVAFWQFLRRVSRSSFDRLMQYDATFSTLYNACKEWITKKQG